MKRTTVMLDEEMYARLKSLARQRGATSGLMIREAVAAYVTAEVMKDQGGDDSPLAPLVGLFDLGAEDVAATMEEYLKATMGRGLPPGEPSDHPR